MTVKTRELHDAMFRCTEGFGTVQMTLAGVNLVMHVFESEV